MNFHFSFFLYIYINTHTHVFSHHHENELGIEKDLHFDLCHHPCDRRGVSLGWIFGYRTHNKLKTKHTHTHIKTENVKEQKKNKVFILCVNSAHPRSSRVCYSKLAERYISSPLKTSKMKNTDEKKTNKTTGKRFVIHHLLWHGHTEQMHI